MHQKKKLINKVYHL